MRLIKAKTAKNSYFSTINISMLNLCQTTKFTKKFYAGIIEISKQLHNFKKTSRSHKMSIG